MRRPAVAVLAVVLGVSMLGITACQRKVRVETGTKYVCTYGENLGSDVKQIEVPASEAGKYSVTTKTITCSRHQRAESLYLHAQAAIEAGDLAAAKKDLEAILKLDSSFRKAPSQLADIQKGKKPEPDLAPVSNSPGRNGPSGEQTSPAQPPGGSSPGMDAYRDMVPDVIVGFTAETISAEDLSLTRAYVPADKSRYDQLVVMVQQCGSPAGAKRVLGTDIKAAYPASGADATVSGLSGYFGANGQGFAVLSLVNGDVLVTLELHATGAKPKDLRSELERLSGTILD